MSTWNLSVATSIIEKLDATFGFGLCIFFDEPLSKALEVFVVHSQVLFFV